MGWNTHIIKYIINRSSISFWKIKLHFSLICRFGPAPILAILKQANLQCLVHCLWITLFYIATDRVPYHWSTEDDFMKQYHRAYNKVTVLTHIIYLADWYFYKWSTLRKSPLKMEECILLCPFQPQGCKYTNK